MKDKLRLIRLLSCAYFALPGIISLIHTLMTDPKYWLRDMIIVFVLTAPFLINKRWFYTGFGFLAALITLLLTIWFIIGSVPSDTGNSVFMYMSGCIFYALGIAASIGLIHVGTYCKEKGRFQLI